MFTNEYYYAFEYKSCGKWLSLCIDLQWGSGRLDLSSGKFDVVEIGFVP
jgi:hypothetical protein